MQMPSGDIPPVREGENVIEIDAKKNHWPFAKFIRLDDGTLAIIVDQNASGPRIGEGAGVAVIKIGKKKSKRLREFLERTEPLG